MTTDHADVAIVGYGPVGNVLAILLAQRGHRVVVLERQPDPYPLPRAVHFDDETGRILQACGIGDELAAISESAEVYEWRNAAGTTLLRFGRVGPGLSGWPQSSMFNQPELECLLDRRARSLPGIDLRRGATVTGLVQDESGVTLEYESPSGAPRSVRAGFAVGCDGARSSVRGLVGVGVVDLGFFYDWLIVDVRLNEERVFDPINLQICDPARPTTLVSGGPGRRRWEFMRLPHEEIETLGTIERAWKLLADWDVTPDNAELERHAVYTFQARWAEHWREGRVLLAGDAAHQMPPFAGQGMCSGLRDAMNLAWKLDLVLGGRAGDGLLDTYEPERMTNVRAVIDFSMELGKVMCVPDPEEARQRDEAMASMVNGDEVMAIPPLPGIETGIVHASSPLAGHLFVQGVVDDGERRARFDDVAGAGFRVVALPGTALGISDELSAWFATIAGRVLTVGDGGELGDPEGTYRAWFADHGVVAVVQRPDFSIYGAAAGEGETGLLLADLRSALS